MRSGSRERLRTRFSMTPLAKFDESFHWEPTERVTTLSNFQFKAPKPTTASLAIVIFSLFMGLLIDFSLAGLVYGLFIFALPAHLAALSSKMFVEHYKDRFPLERAFLTALTGIVVVCIVLVVGMLVYPFLGLGWRFLVIYGYCLDVALRYLIVRSAFVKHRKFTYLYTFQTLVFFLLIFMALALTAEDSFEKNHLINWEETRFLILCILALQGTVYLFTVVVNAPMQDVYRLPATDLIGFYLSHQTSKSHELETLFRRMEEPMTIPLSTMTFRRKSDGETKLVGLVPGLHPGPVGDLGGGNLPHKMQQALADVCPNIMSFHSCSSNDLNPVDLVECNKVADFSRKLIQETTEFEDTATLHAVFEEEFRLTAQMFGKNLMLLHESRDGDVDDLTPGIAMLSQERLAEQIEHLVYVDCHNHANRVGKILNVESRIAMEMTDRAHDLAGKVQDEPRYPFQLGYGQAGGFKVEEGLGAMGIQAFIMEFQGAGKEGGNYRIATILCDGNNMLLEFTRATEELGKEFADEVKVLTTDNHMVNVVIGGYNPIGENTDQKKFLAAVKEALQQASEDMEEVEVGFNSGLVDEVKVIGHCNSLRLTTMITTSFAVARDAAPAFLVLAFLASALAYYIA